MKFYKTKLLLKETFSIAYGNYDSRNALVVELSYAEKTGYGECVEINYYGINLNDFFLELNLLQSKIEKLAIVHPREFYSFLQKNISHSFLRSALDCAYWDLFGKLENKSFIEMNSIPTTNLVESSFTISIAPIDEQIEKVKASAWKKFKIKCNSLDFKNVEKLIAIDKPFALDANASFHKEDCILLQENPLATSINYIEQPMPIGSFDVLDKNKFAVWMADEDAQSEDVLEKLQPHYNAVNIKLMKCGGLTPALGFIKKSKAMGFKVMLGCMTESSIGISAACALAGWLDFADLDGANLISNDYAKGSFVENGTIHQSEKPGLGISLK